MNDQELADRLASAKAAQERTRFAFFAYTLIGLCLLANFWNAYFSIYRDMAFEHFLMQTDDKDRIQEVQNYQREHPEQSKRVKELQHELMVNWVKSRFITVSLLGINFGVGDAPLLGAVALMISLGWFLMAARRENITICTLLYDGWNSYNEHIRWRVYHGIISYAVFSRTDINELELTISTNDPILIFLKRIIRYIIRYRIMRSIMRLSAFTKTYLSKIVHLIELLGKYLAIWILHWLPILILCLVLLCDFRAAKGFIKSPFRIPPDSKLTDTSDLYCYWAISLLLILINILLCKNMRKYSLNIKQILTRYHKLLNKKSHRDQGFNLTSNTMIGCTGMVLWSASLGADGTGVPRSPPAG